MKDSKLKRDGNENFHCFSTPMDMKINIPHIPKLVFKANVKHTITTEHFKANNCYNPRILYIMQAPT